MQFYLNHDTISQLKVSLYGPPAIKGQTSKTVQSPMG
jgi:hypothetical protein